MSKINFLGETDFFRVMDTENLKWRRTNVTQQQFCSFDGIELNSYCAIPEKPKATVVIVHGFCEFFGKYHEYAWYLYRAGYAVFFLEQRGHGYSGGKNKERDVVYIDDYETYLKDLKEFLDQIVIPKSEGQKKLLLAHSMGGAVGTLFLEEYPEYFDAAILSSPMLKMKNNTSPIMLKLLRTYSKIFRAGRSIAPGQNHFDDKPVFETSSALSKPRYDYMFDMRQKDWHYQTYGASIGWALASLDATGKLMENASSIKLPVTVFTAGDDHLIDKDGYTEFAKRVPQAKFYDFEKSRHEIFNADEDSRKQYFQKVLDTLEMYIE